MWERLLRIAAWIGGLALLGLACQALGVDLRGWIEQLLDTVAEISVEGRQPLPDESAARFQRRAAAATAGSVDRLDAVRAGGH